MQESTKTSATSQTYWIQSRVCREEILQKLVSAIEGWLKESKEKNIPDWPDCVPPSMISELSSVLETMPPELSLELEALNGSLKIQELRASGEVYISTRKPPHSLSRQFTRLRLCVSPLGKTDAEPTGNESPTSRMGDAQRGPTDITRSIPQLLTWSDGSPVYK